MSQITTPAWTVLRTPDNGSIEIGYCGDGTVNLTACGTSEMLEVTAFVRPKTTPGTTANPAHRGDLRLRVREDELLSFVALWVRNGGRTMDIRRADA